MERRPRSEHEREGMLAEAVAVTHKVAEACAEKHQHAAHIAPEDLFTVYMQTGMAKINYRNMLKHEAAVRGPMAHTACFLPSTSVRRPRAWETGPPRASAWSRTCALKQ